MEFSIVVPCRNEGNNVVRLTSRILDTLGNQLAYEIIFVDDSNDDTPDILQQLSSEHECLHYLHRVHKTGLSSAILDGFQMARGKWFIVMDADLQHPPESLSALVKVIQEGIVDVVVPSRFISGGSDGGLNAWRKFVSWTARSMARGALSRVRPITDPTSGYFAVKRETAMSQPLHPIGWKILLELLVRSDYEKVKELPYAFESRGLGDSKFGIKEQWNYIRHLVRLIRSSEADIRFWKFCVVGVSGIIINTTVYILCVHWSMTVGLAFTFATMTAMINNFLWNNIFTWNHIKTDQLWYRLIKFLIVSLSGLCLSSLAVTASHYIFDVHYLIAGFIGIVFSTCWNFFLHNLWTFKIDKKASLSPPGTVKRDS